jgi:hypothetical protein
VVECPSLDLGVRLVVGQQTLDLYAEVRILDPQPEEWRIVSFHRNSIPQDSLWDAIVKPGTLFYAEVMVEGYGDEVERVSNIGNSPRGIISLHIIKQRSQGRKDLHEVT